MDDVLFRIYDPVECAVFCKTAEPYGGISNMSAGFPLKVNEVDIRTSEALYQVLRFTSYPDIQKKIIDQKSPMQAKMVGKPYRAEFNREDFKKIRVMLMRWCLRVKLLQNWEKFSETLLETDSLLIVERSTKGDDEWGAVVINDSKPTKSNKKIPRYVDPTKIPMDFLVGYNMMGRLSQELRENIKTGIDPMSENFTRLKPLAVEDFLLYGKPIGDIFRK